MKTSNIANLRKTRTRNIQMIALKEMVQDLTNTFYAATK